MDTQDAEKVLYCEIQDCWKVAVGTVKVNHPDAEPMPLCSKHWAKIVDDKLVY